MTYPLEEWKPVVGFEDLYIVSNLGNVQRKFKCRFKHLDKNLKPSLTQKGYYSVALWRNSAKKTIRIHILVYEAFYGVRPKGSEINHLDGIKINNRADNLEMTDRAGNARHAANKGLIYRRGKVLNPKAVREIRNMHPTLTIRKIAALYGVNHETIRCVINRETWKNVG